MARRVVVTGLGVQAPHGDSPDAVFDALLDGRSAIALHELGEAPHAVTIPSAACDSFDAAAVLGRSRLATMDRGTQLAVGAGGAAWRDAGLDGLPDAEREQVPLLWGTGAGGAQTVERGYRDLFVKGKPRLSPLSVVLGMHNAPAANLALQLRLGGPCLTFSVACASSAVAIGEALQRVRRGEAPLALAGGSEAALPYAMVRAWQSLNVLAPAASESEAVLACRPFDAGRHGLVLGEGAAALVLEDLEHARARGARVIAEVAGYGASCDHHHLTSPDPAGQVRAITAALRDAGAEPGAIGYVNAHGTATPDGDPTEIAALRQVLGAHAATTPVSATKSMHGHLMGAAGALEALVTVLAVQRGALPPTLGLVTPGEGCDGVDHVAGTGRREVDLDVALSNSFAFGGSNAVLVFRRWAG